MTRMIKHLYHRAGFGLDPEAWRERRRWNRQRAVDELFREAADVVSLSAPAAANVNPRMMDKEAIVEMRKEERRRVAQQNVDWIMRMGDPAASALAERMTLFWHGHFACRILQSKLAANYLNTLRRHALGNFRELVLAVARDVAMIRYLNNQQNRKDHPNENFARELMELFTIGRGHYSEQDITEAARAFTGWSSNLAGEFVFRPFLHDFGRKTFFGKSGNFNGEDIIDLILERRETARFITTKIYRYFVNERIDEDRIEQLALGFYRSDYDIGKLMYAIFSSDWFYEPANIGAKIKSPVELTAGMIRTLGLRIEPALALIPLQKSLGQMLFNPPNVAGWPGGRSWIDNSTLTLRLNLVRSVFQNADIPFRPKADLKASEQARRIGRLQVTRQLDPLRELVAGKSGEAAFPVLEDYLLQVSPGVSWSFFEARLHPKKDPLEQMLVGLMSLPEYQLC